MSDPGPSPDAGPSAPPDGPGIAETTEDVAWSAVEHASDVARVARTATQLGRRIGLDERRVGELAIVATELATNHLKHATGGRMLLRVRHADTRAAVEVLAVDAGPGMADARASAADGHSTAGTLGIGLGAVERLASATDVWSAPGRGTTVSATVGEPGEAWHPAPVAGVTRPITGEDVCGDAHAHRRDGDVWTVLVADGLGHGPLAATASQAAVRAFHAAPAAGPAALLDAVHRALQGTRGAAAAIAQLTGTRLTYAGLGNVAGFLTDGAVRRGLVSHPGIVGGPRRAVRETSYDVPPHALLVMHSDGVTDQAALDDLPGLLVRSPSVVAATVLARFGVRRDDASVLVLDPGRRG